MTAPRSSAPRRCRPRGERRARHRLSATRSRRRRDDDDRRHQGGARLPARPAPPALRLVHDRRLHRQRSGDPRRHRTSASAPRASSASASARRPTAICSTAWRCIGRGAVAYVGLDDELAARRRRVLRARLPSGAHRHAHRLGRHAGQRRLPGAAPRPVRRPAGDRHRSLHRRAARRHHGERPRRPASHTS